LERYLEFDRIHDKGALVFVMIPSMGLWDSYEFFIKTIGKSQDFFLGGLWN